MPDHDLAKLWEDHCRHEFGTPDLEGAMATMVDDPYVNHIPTMTGGVGRAQVKRFYGNHLIGAAPADFHLTPVSRTIGADSLVDEMVCSFTHNREIDWMLPGIAPTGYHVEVPVVAIVKFSNGKIAHEHIYWDQASVLVQIGKLNPAGLPVAGVETARKVLNKTLPSNRLMLNTVR
jgi:carboxymethylenebutenolidase